MPGGSYELVRTPDGWVARISGRGAAVLATGAAVLATSGMVRFAGGAADDVRARWPEAVVTGSVADAGRTRAWTVGPGIGTGAPGRDVVAAVLERGVPVCLDARTSITASLKTTTRLSTIDRWLTCKVPEFVCSKAG